MCSRGCIPPARRPSEGTRSPTLMFACQAAGLQHDGTQLFLLGKLPVSRELYISHGRRDPSDSNSEAPPLATLLPAPGLRDCAYEFLFGRALSLQSPSAPNASTRHLWASLAHCLHMLSSLGKLRIEVHRGDKHHLSATGGLDERQDLYWWSAFDWDRKVSLQEQQEGFPLPGAPGQWPDACISLPQRRRAAAAQLSETFEATQNRCSAVQRPGQACHEAVLPMGLAALGRCRNGVPRCAARRGAPDGPAGSHETSGALYFSKSVLALRPGAATKGKAAISLKN